jgi:vacuolar-type H+-ATPase subunit H
MMGKQSDFDRLVDQLGQQRDELLLKMHLAKAEAKDEWEELEEKWQNLQQRLPEARKAASESADNIGAALGLVAEEIGKAYKRLRNTLG